MLKSILKKIMNISYDPYAIAKKYPKNIKIGDSILGKSFRVRVQNMNDSMLTVGDDSILHGMLIYESDAGRISIGNNTWIGNDTKIYSIKNVTIGNNVMLSWNVTIYDHNGNPTDYILRREAFKSVLDNTRKNIPLLSNYDWSHIKSSPIVIQDDAWIGFNVIIQKGVNIGKGAIISSGSVVTQDIPDYCIGAGNPCRVVKKI